MKASRIPGLGILITVAACACGGANGGERPRAPLAAAKGVSAPVASGCGRVHPPASTATPLGALATARAGSTVALATQGKRTLAYAADEDDWTVHVVDVDARKELGETALDGRPSQLMFLPDGRLAVLLR